MRHFCAWGAFPTALAGVLRATALATSLQPTQQQQQPKGPGLHLLYFGTFLSCLGHPALLCGSCKPLSAYKESTVPGVCQFCHCSYWSYLRSEFSRMCHLKSVARGWQQGWQQEEKHLYEDVLLSPDTSLVSADFIGIELHVY